jgi:hypothetical protein
MAFNSLFEVASSNCELLAIALVKELRLRLIWPLPAIIDSSGQAGSFLWWQHAGKSVMSIETAGMYALETPTR